MFTRKSSRRQRDILYLVVQGRTIKQIAAALGLSELNVKFHVAVLFGNCTRVAGLGAP